MQAFRGASAPVASYCDGGDHQDGDFSHGCSCGSFLYLFDQAPTRANPKKASANGANGEVGDRDESRRVEEPARGGGWEGDSFCTRFPLPWRGRLGLIACWKRASRSLFLFPARSLTRFSHSRIACARVPLYVRALYELCVCMCMCAYDDARVLLYLVQGQQPRPEQQRAVKNLQVLVCMVRTGLQRPLLRLQRPQFQQEERLPTRRKYRGNWQKDSPD
jgi:hypothetical protein